MIPSVILTVKIDRTEQEYDMELPADMKIEELCVKLLWAFKNIENELFRTIERIRLRFNEECRFLENDETLSSAAVWDGNIITVVKEGW